MFISMWDTYYNPSLHGCTAGVTRIIRGQPFPHNTFVLSSGHWDVKIYQLYSVSDLKGAQAHKQASALLPSKQPAVSEGHHGNRFLHTHMVQMEKAAHKKVNLQ